VEQATTRGVSLEQALGQVREPYLVVERGGGHELVEAGPEAQAGRVLGYLPAIFPENLGDASFCAAHGVRYPYMAGAMANGIASVEIVEAMGRAGMLGIFGAAGLAPARVEAAIDRLQASLGPRSVSYGFNLIHSPSEPELEEGIVSLYLRRGVRLVEAGAGACEVAD
jgi:hypothetical protein